MEIERQRNKVTLREFFHVMNTFENTIDMLVDGTDCNMAVEFGVITMTPEGEKHFAEALDNLMVDEGYIITSDDNDAYDEYEEKGTGLIALGVELIQALAGWVSCNDYDKWFEGETAKMF